MCDIINSVQNFSAKDACADGETALNLLSKGRYDAMVLTMVVPKVSGTEVMEKMRKSANRTPVIAISVGDEALAKDAFKLGAKDFIVRPFRLSPMERPVFSRKLTLSLHYAVGDGQVRIRTYRETSSTQARERNGMSSVASRGVPSRDILTSRALGNRKNEGGSQSLHAGLPAHTSGAIKHAPASSYKGKYSLIAIASSTGGPQALHTMLPMLPGNIGVPVVIVQHMPKGFTASLAERIDAKANLKVKEAENGEVLKRNCVYIAPGGRHLQIVNNPTGQLACKVYDDPPVNNLRPCADVMYESLRKVNCDHIICTVLTGMGADGSAGIASLRKVKDLYVITQSEDTCVVYGMPKATDQAGLSNESQPIDQISSAITKKLGV